MVLVGRPNVGKSTLFNRLTKTKDAIVADLPGLTRDRHYGEGRLGDFEYLVVDTGGFEPIVDSGILFEMAKQTLQAIDEADVAVFLVDARAGVTPQDHLIANRLRQAKCRVILAVNKSEGIHPDVAAAEFFELGLGEPIIISAAHGEGVKYLIDYSFAHVLDQINNNALDDSLEKQETLRFAIIGRPNVGKSTLSNVFLGEDRLIAFDQPGTTRDSIAATFQHQNYSYTLVDTAGVRRRSRVDEAVEKFSVIKTLQSIKDAHVSLLILDASQDVADQDAFLANFVIEAGRALVVVINKWDVVPKVKKDELRKEVARKLHFLDFATFHFISAKQPTTVFPVLESIRQAYASSIIKLSTPRLTRVLKEAVSRQAPAYTAKVRPKMRYAHQGGMAPPVIIIHGNHLQGVQESYTRYLEKVFRKVFKLIGTPIRIEYKYSSNPYTEQIHHTRSKKN
jgi:GTP-binding protein